MGLFGISLLFVGITLISNGVNRLTNVAARSTAFMNCMTGLLLLVGNIIALTKAIDIAEYHHVASGFIYAVVYLFIAANDWFAFDLRPFGWYALLAAIYTAIMAVLSVAVDIRIALLWSAWAILLFMGFLELVPKMKLSKVPAVFSIFAGIFAGFVPALLILTNAW